MVKHDPEERTMKTSTTLFALFALLALVAACAPTGPGGTGSNNGTTTRDSGTAGTYQTNMQFDPTAKLSTQTFKTEDELRAFINANSGSSRGGVMLDNAMVKSTGVANMAAAPMMAGEVSTPDHSTTNNQVASVDEADIIKTDGNYIYTITGNTLFIIKAYPGEDAKVVSTIALKSRPQGLFIDGDHLAVLGNFYDQAYFKTLDFIPRQGMVFLTVYDISDKKNPQALKEYKFEGNYQQARMANGKIYMVVQSRPIYRDHPMPLYIDGTTVKNVAVDSIRYFPVPYDNAQFTTVQSIDLSHPEKRDSATVTTTWTNTVYMSEDNIYVASTENINEWEIRREITMQLLEPKLTAREQTLIQKIKSTDDEVLSLQEKRSKIWQVYNEYEQYKMESEERQTLQDEIDTRTKEKLQSYDALTYTVINRISVKNGLSVEANGRVPGTLNNQFSMDEYDTVLRVATTLSQNAWWRSPPIVEESTTTTDAKIEVMVPRRSWQRTNNVYTLDKNLKVLDKMEGIAEGETIQSARFMGDRLYLVTFRQVDPFFVFDLSNPRNIKELGSLKVPGFSRYLHPYDGNTIIGIGQDASATGRRTGLKISLFDVSDVAHPKEVAKFVAEGDYSSSTAEYEHKAFLFDKEKQLLVIPAYSNTYSNGVTTGYNGAMVFKITPTEITLRGIIDHSNGNQRWGATVERSLWIDDLLYTKSPHLLRINNLSDLSSVKRLDLEQNSAGPYPVY